MKTFLLILSIFVSHSLYAYDVAKNADQAKVEICEFVRDDYSDYMSEEDCLEFEIEEVRDEWHLTMPFCGDWQQYVLFMYDQMSGQILEGSYGDASESCEE